MICDWNKTTTEQQEKEKFNGKTKGEVQLFPVDDQRDTLLKKLGSSIQKNKENWLGNYNGSKVGQ